jgi:hypothetical protein
MGLVWPHVMTYKPIVNDGSHLDHIDELEGGEAWQHVHLSRDVVEKWLG